MNFFDKLSIASQKNNSLLCVGLDPDIQMIPDNNPIAFNELIIKATADLACAYKPNLAIYEAMGEDGLNALKQTINIIRELSPHAVIIGDGKRGDIGLCSHAYRYMLFEKYKFDGVTVNPYMGSDSIEPFLEYKDRCIFILCRTSNRGGNDIQELMVKQGNRPIAPLYEIVAELACTKWNENGNVGLVVGATYPEQIYRVRQICPDMLFLIPGVGFQGGNIEKTVHSAANSEGKGFIINVSRQIMYAAKTSDNKRRNSKDAVKNMRTVAEHIRDEINRYLPKPLKPLKDEQKNIPEEITDRTGSSKTSQEDVSTPAVV